VISYETSHSGVNKTHSLRKQRVGIDPSNFVQATRLSELLLGNDGAVRSEHVRTVGGPDVLFLPLAETARDECNSHALPSAYETFT
jgi:hypothetical protein